MIGLSGLYICLYGCILHFLSRPPAKNAILIEFWNWSRRLCFIQTLCSNLLFRLTLRFLSLTSVKHLSKTSHDLNGALLHSWTGDGCNGLKKGYHYNNNFTLISWLSKPSLLSTTLLGIYFRSENSMLTLCLKFCTFVLASLIWTKRLMMIIFDIWMYSSQVISVRSNESTGSFF